MRDEHFGAAPTLTESDGGLWSLPMAAPASEPHDWQCLYEQAQARAETERADAAEARVQELLNDIRRLRTSLRQAEVGKSARGPVPRNTLGAHEVTTGQPLRALDCSQERRDEIAALRRKVAARRRLKRPAQALRPGASARLPQGAGTGAEAEGHDQSAARGRRFPQPGGPPAEPGGPPAASRARAIAGPQGDSPLADHRNQAAARGAGGLLRPDGRHRRTEDARPQSGNRLEGNPLPRKG